MSIYNRRHFGLKLLGCVLLLLFLFCLSLALGSSSMGFKASIQVLLHDLTGHEFELAQDYSAARYGLILYQIRLPRILLALGAGAALTLVGAVFQASFRNPLADPHILGVSAGAAFGATLAVVSGLALPGFALGVMGSFAFATSLLTVALVYLLAGSLAQGQANTIMLITGTALSTLLSALISLLMLFNHDMLERIYLWTLGSFAGSTWSKLAFLYGLLCPTALYLLSQGQVLNIMQSGEEEALSLGVDTTRKRRQLIAVASLLTATVVSVSGIIGFVGLIIPHAIRLLGETDLRRQLPLAFLAGASFMLFCDTMARTILAPVEIPVGIITAVFGVPYFVSLLFWQRRRKER